jgi:hypothetical protein
MSSIQLHEHPETHLYDGSFSELAASHINQGDRVLLLAPTSADARNVRSAFPGAAETSHKVTQYVGDDTALPFDGDQFDVTILLNPSRGILQRHTPLYEATAVTAPEGQIVYGAPNYLAHSEAATIDTLYAVGWENGDPSLAAILTVDTPGDPRVDDERPHSGGANLSEFINE